MAGETFPIGTVLLFVGTFVDNTTMVGWYVCDGSDSAPNIVDKFLRGAAASGGTGGTDDAVVIAHTHPSISIKLGHTHGGTSGAVSSTHYHTFHPWVFAAGGGGGAATNFFGSSGAFTLYYSEGAHDHSGDMVAAGGHGHTTPSSGAAGAGKNLPEYKRAIPIIRLA